MEKSEKVHFRSCSALCNSSSCLTFALLSSLQQYLWEYILFVLLAPEVSSIRRLWSVNMVFNPIHLAHIVVTAQPSVQLSPFTKVSIHQLVTDSSFRKFNICKSYTSWLYFSPIIIIMFGMCGYSFFFSFQQKNLLSCWFYRGQSGDDSPRDVLRETRGRPCMWISVHRILLHPRGASGHSTRAQRARGVYRAQEGVDGVCQVGYKQSRQVRLWIVYFVKVQNKYSDQPWVV